MGKIVLEKVIYKRLELTKEDLQLRAWRRATKSKEELHPNLFDWHRGFAARLKKCPNCGETPQMACIWTEDRGYSYKFWCGFHDKKRNGDTALQCGDWYYSLSRAGLDWNYRVAEATGWPHRIVRHYHQT